MQLDFNADWNYSCDEYGINKTVHLPHDAMIDGTRSRDSLGGGACAYFCGGIYVYEKTFDVPLDWKHKCISFLFEGVYRKAKVYINGELAKEWAYGYTEFYVDADKYLRYGELNTIKVVADNSNQPNSRWYTGGGIYRPVSLIINNKIHIDHYGVTISTLSINPAVVSVKITHNGGMVSVRVFDGKNEVATAVGDDVQLTIDNAKLWSAETPHLYTAKIVLTDDGKIVDEREISFGIRTLEANAKDGLLINGKSIKLRGGCVHHDNGILGACAYEEAEYRKVRIIKQAGYNAIRFSHNPCSRAFVAACDKYGIYLIDELSDMWYMRKKKFDYALDFDIWHERDVAAIVGKDKNSPSVIMYSIGNELSEPCENKGVEMAKSLVALFKSLDSMRLVTAGMNLSIINNASKGKGLYSEERVEADSTPKKQKEKPTSSTLFNMVATRVGPAMNKMSNSDEVDRITTPTLDCLDVAGYNYASGRYYMDGVKHPNRVILGSETFPQDIYKNWYAVKQLPYLVGDFMWTAFDYLGEVGLGAWSYEKQYGFSFEKPYPWLIADAGAIDLIGNAGAEAKYAAVVWGLCNKPVICVKPVNHAKDKVVKMVWRGTNAIESWAWGGCEGNKAEVEVYSDGAYIRLELNGKTIGTKRLKECKAVFSVKYASGTITAISLDGNKQEVSRSTLYSASKDLQIKLSTEKEGIMPDELAFVNVCISDENGIVECNADRQLKIETNGQLIAFGSAQQKSEEKYSSNITDTYYGRALAVVKAPENGILHISVSDNRLNSVLDIPISK